MAAKKEEVRENPFTKGRTSPKLSETIGKADQGSRKKAEQAADQAGEEIKRVQAEPLDVPAGWPLGSKGTPMMRAEMSAAELIPTGQYANVSVGPARLHFLIDPDRELADGESYFSADQRALIAKAMNEVAEIVEGDVVAVQRNLVMENIQNDNET